MKRILILMAVLLAPVLAVWAEATDESTAAAEKLLTVMQLDESFDKTMAQSMEMARNMAREQMAEAPAEEIDKAMEHMDRVYAKVQDSFSWKNIRSTFVEIYADVFTADEIQAMIDFYTTPIGKKFIEKQPELTTRTMQSMQGLMKNMMEDVQSEMEALRAGEEAAAMEE